MKAGGGSDLIASVSLSVREGGFRDANLPRQPLLKTDQERAVVARQIEATERQIDQLVYGLYSLTDQKIALVELATIK